MMAEDSSGQNSGKTIFILSVWWTEKHGLPKSSQKSNLADRMG